MRTATLMVLLLALGGCKLKRDRGDAGAIGATKTPTIQVAGNKLTIPEYGATGTALVQGFDYTLFFEKLPKATKVKIGDKEGTVGEYGSYSFKTSIASDVAGLSPKDAFDVNYKFDPKLPIVISFPDGAALTTSAPPETLAIGLGQVFEKLKDGPVLFGAEPTDKVAHHTVLFTSGLTKESLGPATTLRDVDWVALSEKMPGRPGKTCSGYKTLGNDKAKGNEHSYSLSMIDEEISIFERRTGKVIEKKRFAAPNECPMFASGKEATSYPRNDDIKRWLRERRDKK